MAHRLQIAGHPVGQNVGGVWTFQARTQVGHPAPALELIADGADCVAGVQYEVTVNGGGHNAVQIPLTINPAHMVAGVATLPIAIPPFMVDGQATIDIEATATGTVVARIDVDVDPAAAQPAPAGGAQPAQAAPVQAQAPAGNHDVDFTFNGQGHLRLRYPNGVGAPQAPAQIAPAPQPAANPGGSSLWKDIMIGLIPIMIILGLLGLGAMLMPTGGSTTSQPTIVVNGCCEDKTTAPPVTTPPAPAPAPKKVIDCPEPCNGQDLITAIQKCAGGKDACRRDKDCRALCEADATCRDWLK